MPTHIAPGSGRPDDSHGAKAKPRGPDRYAPTAVRRINASSVPYGEQISRNGRTVWAAYLGAELIALGSTADEARAKARKIIRDERTGPARVVTGLAAK